MRPSVFDPSPSVPSQATLFRGPLTRRFGLLAAFVPGGLRPSWTPCRSVHSCLRCLLRAIQRLGSPPVEFHQVAGKVHRLLSTAAVVGAVAVRELSPPSCSCSHHSWPAASAALAPFTTWRPEVADCAFDIPPASRSREKERRKGRKEGRKIGTGCCCWVPYGGRARGSRALQFRRHVVASTSVGCYCRGRSPGQRLRVWYGCPNSFSSQTFLPHCQAMQWVLQRPEVGTL